MSVTGVFLMFFSREISSQDLQAGSDGERVLGQKVLEKFRTFGMDHWKDVHYVKLQVPSG